LNQNLPKTKVATTDNDTFSDESNDIDMKSIGSDTMVFHDDDTKENKKDDAKNDNNDAEEDTVISKTL